ncbi:MAG: hypothetical protein H0X17_15510 [Deltaproteobacteria bacterium]|nr:hypothetical protein [Deltaproteobacteria bacterium]
MILTTTAPTTITAPTRLQTIATRQARTRVRDALFTALIALATVISISSIGTAAHAASTQIVSR